MYLYIAAMYGTMHLLYENINTNQKLYCVLTFFLFFVVVIFKKSGKRSYNMEFYIQYISIYLFGVVVKSY